MVYHKEGSGMAKTKKKIVLSSEQRNTLLAFLSSGSKSVRLTRRAQIILALNTSNNRIPLHDEQIGNTYQVSRQTIQVIKDAFLHSPSLDLFLQRKKRATPPITPKVTGDVEAHIIALCCSTPPEGYARWTVRLLADKCVELGIIASISPMTINRTLKKRM
jgi:hypothetical protein